MTMTGLVSLLAGNTAVALALALFAWGAGRARRPALAHVAWLLVLVKLVTPPLWRVPVTNEQSAATSAASVAPAIERPVTATAVPLADVPQVVADRPIAPDQVHADVAAVSPVVLAEARAEPFAVCWPCLLMAVWAAGGSILGFIGIVRVARFRRLLRDVSPADDALQRDIANVAARMGITRLPMTNVLRAPVSPMLWFIGIGTPRLILPAALLETMDAAQRGGVIAHELAHLRRRDHWVRLLEIPVTLLLWFHPLVWVARRGLREAEEQCCDAWAVSVLPAGRRRYADALVSAMELIAGARRPPLGATGLGRLGALRRRLTMIVTQSPPKSLSMPGRLAVVLLVAAVVIAPVRGQQTEQPAPTVAAAEGPAFDVAPGASLQDAIDKAPDGGIIRLAAGAYPEAITITKPITLIGAGWEHTTLGSERPRALSQARKEEFLRKLDATTDPQERARIAMELASASQPPSIAVKRAAGVTIRGVRVVGPPTGSPDGLTNETLVHFDAAPAGVVSECAVVGPASNGVTIVNGSDVRIEKSLVAAIWNIGVRVHAGERGRSDVKPAKVHLVDSDVRNCYHRCVTISGDASAVSVVERCRISGSAWHGIRYDHCSPTIKDNLIFGSARSGIYASGKTAATVTGNLFWRNEMDAMSCWFDNADTVEGNTIVGNLREGISVLGNSETKLVRNAFVRNPVGVLGGQIASRNNEPGGTPKPQLAANVFWDNKEEFKIGEEVQPLPPGNERVDPKFVAPEKGDFTLAPDSAARKLGAGAADPIPLASPFPIQSAETAMIPNGETRDYQQWKRPQPTDAAAGANGADDIRLAAAQEPAAAADKGVSATAATEQQRERQRAFAKSRVRQDARRFPKGDVAEADELYQAASKDWRSDAARANVKTLMEKFPDFNRTGCAVLYFGQWSRGAERERLLKAAAEKHGDCFYGNGVQVGAFARYLLGHDYREQGKTVEAEKAFDEIRKNYSEAITPRGDLLVAVLREEAKGTTKPNTSTQPIE